MFRLIFLCPLAFLTCYWDVFILLSKKKSQKTYVPKICSLGSERWTSCYPHCFHSIKCYHLPSNGFRDNKWTIKLQPDWCCLRQEHGAGCSTVLLVTLPVISLPLVCAVSGLLLSWASYRQGISEALQTTWGAWSQFGQMCSGISVKRKAPSHLPRQLPFIEWEEAVIHTKNKHTGIW